MLDFLVGFLPDALQSVATWALLLLAFLFVAGLLVRRFSSRRALLVRAFGKPATESLVDGAELADAVRGRLREIWKAHASRDLYVQGETTSLADPRRVTESLGSRAAMLLAGDSPLGLLLELSTRIWPALELEGEVVIGEERTLVCCARLRRGDRFYHAWQVRLPGECERPDAVVEELAYRIALDSARLGVLDASRSAGTRDWRAFRALTEAMKLWNRDGFDTTDAAMVARVDAKLAEAVERDPDYALAHLNRGTLHLVTFRDATTNRIAREHFERAREAARRRALEESHRKVTVDRRVEGQAVLGIARTLSQDRHRYGRTEEEVVRRAREAASEAVTLLDRSPEALYALAFAWHCTETLEDIREGRRLYEEIVRREPGRYTAVHNNLGYILMVGGERLRDAGRTGEAEGWWREAEREMRTTLRIGEKGRRTEQFSHANLGNLHRLRGRYEEAEREYRLALGPDPERSSYTNGLNELARLYLETGRTAEAERFHRLALASTEDPEHRWKLERDYRAIRSGAPALDSGGRAV